MSKIHFALLFGILLWTQSNQAYSEELLSDGGDPTYDFLRIPMSARAASLGNTFVTVQNDPSTIFFNVGALSTIEAPSGSIGFIKHLLDVNAGCISYAQKISNLGSFGAGITYVNYGSFDRTDRSGGSTGTFGASDIALSLAYGNAVEELHYGGALKVIYSYIDDVSSSGVAVDAGALYYIPKQEIVLALSLTNVGTQLSTYSGINERLPLDLSIGVSKKLEHLPLTLLLNFHKLTDAYNNFFDRFTAFSFGGEFILSKVLRARVGYNNEMRKELKIGTSSGMAGFAAGFGLKISGILIDYGFTSFGKIGDLHRFSIGTSF